MSTPDHTDHDTAPDRETVVVVGQNGIAAVDPAGDAGPADLVEQPAKVMRIGGMIKQLLEEVRAAPLDEAGRARLRDVHERSIRELEQGLSGELVEELRRVHLPFDEGSTPSESELRIAQAQLVGWLEGLFHGIQAALMAQQLAAQAQVSQLRRALPGRPDHEGRHASEQPGHPGQHPQPPGHGTGQYL